MLAPKAAQRAALGDSLLPMHSVIRRLLVLLLLMSLPIQGWATSRMALAMATGHGSGAVGAVGAVSASAPEPGHLHSAGHAHAAHMNADAPDAPDTSDCCAGHHAEHAHDGTHASCSDTCHCCIGTAPPATGLHLPVQHPPADWLGSQVCAFADFTAHAPKKPPKG